MDNTNRNGRAVVYGDSSLEPKKSASLVEARANGNSPMGKARSENIAYKEPAVQAQAPATLPADEPTTQEAAPPVPPAPPARKRPVKLILGVLGVGAIVASIFGFRWWQFASAHETTDNATVAGHVYQISSRIPGTVAKVPVTDNQQVRQGELLVQLDPSDYQAKVQQALAALTIAQRQAQSAQSNISLASQTSSAKTAEAQGNVLNAIAAISTAQAAVAEAQAGVPAAQAQVTQAQAQLQRAETDFTRYNNLFQQGAVPRQQLDTARATRDVAAAQLSVAQQGVAQARAKLAQAQQGVTQAQAQLQASQGGLQQAQAGGVQTDVNRGQFEAANASIVQAQANLKEAQLQLSYINIVAPEPGRVGRKTVEVGQQLTAGQPLMAVVGDQMWVVANFKETQMGDMRPGESVEVELDAVSGHTFTGKVDSISPASGAQFSLLPPDNATGNFTKIVQRIPVKVLLDADSIRGYETQITPGMSASVSVQIK